MARRRSSSSHGNGGGFGFVEGAMALIALFVVGLGAYAVIVSNPELVGGTPIYSAAADENAKIGNRGVLTVMVDKYLYINSQIKRVIDGTAPLTASVDNMTRKGGLWCTIPLGIALAALGLGLETRFKILTGLLKGIVAVLKLIFGKAYLGIGLVVAALVVGVIVYFATPDKGVLVPRLLQIGGVSAVPILITVFWKKIVKWGEETLGKIMIGGAVGIGGLSAVFMFLSATGLSISQWLFPARAQDVGEMSKLGVAAQVSAQVAEGIGGSLGLSGVGVAIAAILLVAGVIMTVKGRSSGGSGS